MCFEKYKMKIFEMEKVISKQEHIDIVHRCSENEIIILFTDSQKMGNKRHEEEHKKNLEKKINEFREHWYSKTKESCIKIENARIKASVFMQTMMEENSKQFEQLQKVRAKYDELKSENEKLQDLNNESLKHFEEMGKKLNEIAEKCAILEEENKKSELYRMKLEENLNAKKSCLVM